MSLPYSTRFFIGAPAAAAWRDNYTVPAGKVAVVRFVHALFTNSGDQLALGIGTADQYYNFKATTTPQYTTLELRVVAAAGETLKSYAYTGAVSFGIHGFLLDAA